MTFEEWYAGYNPAHKSDKERAEDAWKAATQAQAGTVPLTDEQIESLLYKYGYDPDDEHMAAMLKEANSIKGGQHGTE